MSKTLTVIIEHDQASGYYAYCPDLIGCHSQGNALEETVQNLREAAELYLEVLTNEEQEQLTVFTTTAL